MKNIVFILLLFSQSVFAQLKVSNNNTAIFTDSIHAKMLVRDSNGYIRAVNTDTVKAIMFRFVNGSITATGNMRFVSNVIQDYAAIISTTIPVNAGTVALLKGTNVVNPATGLLSLTLQMPTSPIEGDICTIAFSQTITALTMTSSVTIYNAPTAAVAGTSAVYQYLFSKWVKI